MPWRPQLAHQLEQAAPELTADSYRLFFNFLRISPSYALVSNQQGQIKVTRKTPTRTRQLLAVFDSLGNVHTTDFDNWQGPSLITSGIRTPRVRVLKSSAADQVVLSRDCVLMAVPRSLSRARQLAECKALLDKNDVKAATPTQDTRIRTLWKALACVYARAKNPDLELWRIGLLANAVTRFRGVMSPEETRKLAAHAEMRRHLTLMVIRLMFTALVISENAALGRFPDKTSQSATQMAFPFEAHQLDRLLSASGDFEYNYIMQRVDSPFLIAG
jgi:hypothetical protein